VTERLLRASALCALLLLAACGESRVEYADSTPVPDRAPARPAGIAGKVIETMNSGGYTYVHVDTGSAQVWAAAPETQVSVGDQVQLPPGQAMPNFHSATLDRTFEQIYFVSAILPAGAVPAAGGDDQAMEKVVARMHAKTAANQADSAPAVDYSGLTAPEGGKRVAEIFATKAELAGQPVVLRGKVVRYNANIMGKNWLHVRDGSGATGTNDLTVTTSVPAKVGDTVLVKGTLVLDRDFGYGYKYDLIIEDANVTVE
jgi:hypothetical protein